MIEYITPYISLFCSRNYVLANAGHRTKPQTLIKCNFLQTTIPFASSISANPEKALILCQYSGYFVLSNIPSTTSPNENQF